MNKLRPLSQKLGMLLDWQRRYWSAFSHTSASWPSKQIITMGKKGGNGSIERASAFLLKQSVVPKLFTTFAQRYAERSGGYTRIHKFGNRQGDNAPHAILELVDNPRDLRFEMTARAVGRETVKAELSGTGPQTLLSDGVSAEKARSAIVPGTQKSSMLQPKTLWNLRKVLRYRGPDATQELSKKASEYAVSNCPSIGSGTKSVTGGACCNPDGF